MGRRVLVITLIGVAVLYVVILFIYCSKFGWLLLSSSKSEWGTFGDFLGGVLNPIISLLNLFIIYHLTIKIDQGSKKRENEVLSLQVKPFPDMIFISSPDKVEINLENGGLGPMVIKQFRLVSIEGKVSTSFKDTILGFESEFAGKYMNSMFTFSGEAHVIRVGDTRCLFSFELQDKSNVDNIKYIDALKARLEKWRIVLTYENILGEQIPEYDQQLAII
jgi:hypothetical protein